MSTQSTQNDQRLRDWKKTIMSLSEMENNSSINPVMAYPCNAKENEHGEFIIEKPYVCCHDDGFLCKHRAKWIVGFVEKIISQEKRKYGEELIDKCMNACRDENNNYTKSAEEIENKIAELRQKNEE